MATGKDSAPALKLCRTCGETKPLTDFGNRGDRPCGKRAKCKACANEYNRAYLPAWSRKPESKAKLKAYAARNYVANRERIMARHKEWRRANPEAAKRLSREGLLRRRYGLTAAAFSAMLGKQDGRCAICVKILDRGRRTHIDHCHTTDRVRSLLCAECNAGLGIMRDDPEILRRAADYIEFHRRKAKAAA